METIKTKVCKCCGKELPITEYSKDRQTKDGYSNKCKVCKSAQYKKWYDKHHPKPKTASPSIFADPQPPQYVSLQNMTDSELFAEIRRRGYTGELRYNTVITV